MYEVLVTCFALVLSAVWTAHTCLMLANKLHVPYMCFFYIHIHIGNIICSCMYSLFAYSAYYVEGTCLYRGILPCPLICTHVQYIYRTPPLKYKLYMHVETLCLNCFVLVLHVHVHVHVYTCCTLYMYS